MSADKVTIDRESLAILLEYAYRGDGAQGAPGCRNVRDPGCALCAAFEEADAVIHDGPAPYEARNWWVPTAVERWRLRRYRRTGKPQRKD